MIRQNYGHVITIASMASYVTAASNVDYSYSKASVLASGIHGLPTRCGDAF